jgi:hypothetical protein
MAKESAKELVKNIKSISRGGNEMLDVGNTGPKFFWHFRKKRKKKWRKDETKKKHRNASRYKK